MHVLGFRGRRAAIPIALVLAAIWIGTAANASAQDKEKWLDANKLAGAIGGWRAYIKERAAPPEGYPAAPKESERLTPAEVLAAETSIDSAARLAEWESRRYAQRSAPLEPPTLSFARTSGEAESSSEYGLHFPVGSWIERARSLAADEDDWGLVERRGLQLGALRDRLVVYADAVAAKAELARAMDRLEVQSVLEELTRRLRDIGSVPAFELLSFQIERADAQAAEATARETALRAAERLALAMRRPLSEAAELQRRLPLEPLAPQKLPALDDGKRLDVQMAQENLAQQQTRLSRARTGLWVGGVELGVVQKRYDSGQVDNTIEVSWRLPLGGEASRDVNVGQREVQDRQLRLRNVEQIAAREIAQANRAKAIADQRLKQATQALDSAEAWMEEQVYRYSGMLIGPQDILRAATRLRQVQSLHIAAQRQAFVANVDALFVKAIPTQPAMPESSPMPASSAGGMH